MESKPTPQSPISPASPLSPPGLNRLDSSGRITLDLTIPASDVVLGDKLGQGAFGVVYKGQWRNKPVAVKQLLLPSPSEQEKTEFKQEAAVMFQISADSEHVVRLYKITIQPHFSLVMELMPKGNLYELLQNNRDTPLLWEVRYRLAMDISTGLDDIHAHGVLHRDLKSLNVLLDNNLRAKLTDFGLAGIRSASSRHSSAKGTPHWMAPEVINGDPATEGSDVYSLGMVLWELATHRQPYAHLSNPMQIMFQVAQGKLETIPDNCPASFKQLILDCWSIASKRPKAAEVTTRLQPMLESKAAPSTALLASVSLTSMPNYQKPTPTLPIPPLKPEETKMQQPDLLASMALASNPHYQPQATMTMSKPPEEISAGTDAFQTGYQLYNLTCYQKALPHFQQAANEHYPPAYSYLGLMYEKGYGVDKNPVESTLWYEKERQQEKWLIQQADSGEPKGQFYLGHYYQFAAGAKKDFKQAVAWYRRAAEQEHAGAQFSLGVCYGNSQGVARDYRQAIAWLNRAAKLGHARAQFRLGECYAKGQGVEQDFEQAVTWYRRAAEQGHIQAQYIIGVCYTNGQGVTQDNGQAVTWYRRAAEQAYAPAQCALGDCYANGQGVSQDDEEAVTWYHRAAEQEHAAAQYSLGRYYAQDQGIAQDGAQAVTWFRRAAEQGHIQAQYIIAVCYTKGQGVTQDNGQAVTWYRRAAEQGHVSAQFNLGVCYYFGEGTDKDYEKAVTWYRRAAKQGHAEAQCSLGDCYANGIGVSKDPAQAKQWYEKAAARGNATAKAQLKALQPPAPSVHTPSSFFAGSNFPKPGSKVEANQAINNSPQVAPKPVPEKSAAAVVVDEKALGQLLKCVAEGEQDQAEALIKKDSNLLLATGKVTDLSGRTFDNITAFQYALWAMDYHMWTMIQKYLPEEAQIEQHEALERKGTAHGKHFDLQPLLDALKTYVDNGDKWNYDQRATDQWCKKVGGAQKLLPAHVVNEYCRFDRPFEPCPKEWISGLPRTRAVINVWDGAEYAKGESWFVAPQLGESFAFYRYSRAGAGVGDPWEVQLGEREFSPGADLKSLQALWTARTQQLKLLGAKLVPISTPVEDAKPEAKLEAKQAASNQAQAGPKLLPALSAQSHKQAESNAQQPGLLASVSLASNLHYQPQAVAVKAKSQEPSEEKSAGLEAFQKGEQLYWQGQYQKALPFFQRAAKNHYPPAYLYLGCMYEFEQGVVKDYDESISWFSKAQAQETWFTEQAAKGNATGQRHLGGYYQFAAGAKKDLTKAVIWYRRAAEQGDAEAQYNLGCCYDAGKGVERDNSQAVIWFRRAAEQEIAFAQHALGACYQRGEGVAQNYVQAVSWYRRAAEQEIAFAQHALGACYQRGEGVAQNYVQAVSWYRRAAEQGYAAAQYNLGYCYETGRGLGKTPQLAKQWYEKAAAQSNEDAITALAALLKANPSLASNPSSFFASSLVKPDTKPDAKQAAGNQVQAASKPKPPPGKPFGK